jgi:hypothetical protein
MSIVKMQARVVRSFARYATTFNRSDTNMTDLYMRAVEPPPAAANAAAAQLKKLPKEQQDSNM